MGYVYRSKEDLQKLSRKELEKLADKIATLRKETKDPEVHDQLDEEAFFIWAEIERRLR